jgi:DNA-binding transcriptional MerR regulator
VDTKSYRISELVDEANKRRLQDPELRDTPEFDRRMIYYYVQEGLLPRHAGQKPGTQTRYPEEFIDRLLFIRRVQKATSLPVKSIAGILSGIRDKETIHRVAIGKERLKIARVGEAVAAPGEESLLLNSLVEPSALDEFDAIVSHEERRRPSAREREPAEKFAAGDRAQLEVKGPVSERQRRQLTQAAELIRSILENDD